MNRLHELFKLLRGDLVVMLTVYADESGTGDPSGKAPGSQSPVLCGFIESPNYWLKFEKEWADVLKRHGAPHFHFREFVDKKNRYKIKDNPFLSWDEERRDNFICDLAIVAGRSAVPIGGCLNIAKQNQLGLGGAYDQAIRAFYLDFQARMIEHWPNFNGEVLFIFDENKDEEKWAAPLSRIHREFKKFDTRIGTKAEESDRKIIPLQAADMLSFCVRQSGERRFAIGRRQQYGLLEFILTANARAVNRSFFSTVPWLMPTIVQDYKRKRARWAKTGEKKKYYPLDDFPFIEHGIDMRVHG